MATREYKITTATHTEGSYSTLARAIIAAQEMAQSRPDETRMVRKNGAILRCRYHHGDESTWTA